MVRESD